jgi:membrane-anchored protein YejM (alkaline phosphatase superfamily)
MNSFKIQSLFFEKKSYAFSYLALAALFALCLVETADYLAKFLQSIFPPGSNGEVDRFFEFQTLFTRSRLPLFLLSLALLFLSAVSLTAPGSSVEKKWRIIRISGAFGVMLVGFFSDFKFLYLFAPFLILLGNDRQHSERFSALTQCGLAAAAVLVTASSIIPFPVTTFQQQAYIFALGFVFLLPFILWSIVRNLFSTKKSLFILLPIFIYFVADRAISGLARSFGMEHIIFYVIALLSFGMLLVALPLQRSFKKSYWIFYGGVFLVWVYATREVFRVAKRMEKNLVDDAMVDLLYGLAPLLTFIVMYPLMRVVCEKWPKVVLVASSFVFAIASYGATQYLAPWTTTLENHWPSTSYVANKAWRALDIFGVSDNRPARKYSTQLSGLVKNYSAIFPFMRAAPLAPNLLKTKPNIFIFVTDAVTKRRLSTYGNERITSPNLDEFAKESFVFENHTAAASDTFQNVTTIFSGLYAGRSGIESANKKTYLCTLLRNNDYKMFIASVTEGLDLNQKNCASAVTLSYEGFDSESRALLFSSLEAEAVKPTATPHFAYIHVRGGHTTWDWLSASESRFGPEGIDKYDSLLFYADRQFGEFISHLKKIGVYDNSIIVFTSDHGIGLGVHADKGSYSKLYSDNINIPLLIKMPLQHENHKVFHLTSHTDFVPTLAELLAVSLEDDFHGSSFASDLLSLGQNEVADARCVYSIAAYREAYSILCPSGDKLIWYKDINSVSYYKTANDTLDEHDLIGEISPAEFKPLAEKLARFVRWGQNSYSRPVGASSIR